MRIVLLILTVIVLASCAAAPVATIRPTTVPVLATATAAPPATPSPDEVAVGQATYKIIGIAGATADATHTAMVPADGLAVASSYVLLLHTARGQLAPYLDNPRFGPPISCVAYAGDALASTTSTVLDDMQRFYVDHSGPSAAPQVATIQSITAIFRAQPLTAHGQPITLPHLTLDPRLFTSAATGAVTTTAVPADC
jgi:hypothetical protein